MPKEMIQLPLPPFLQEYTSKSKRGECKNEDCDNAKRHGSSYCQTCSDNYKKGV